MSERRKAPGKGPAKKSAARKARKPVLQVKKSAVRKRVASPKKRPAVKVAKPVVSEAVMVQPPQPPSVPLVVKVPPAPMHWRALASFFAFVIAVTAMGGLIIRSVDAATFQGPSAAPPGGNIPITIWNRVSSGAKQTSAAIDIDGGVTSEGMIVMGLTTPPTLAAAQNLLYGNINGASAAGSKFLNLQTAGTTRFWVDRDGNMNAGGTADFGSPSKALTGTQNLIYGNVDTTSVATSSLLLLQNESVDRFRVDVAGNVTALGKMKSTGCFGSVFVGLTPVNYHGTLGAVTSYYAADNRCNTAFAGSHVCRVEEVLESIRCSVAGDPIRTNGGAFAWINGGTPGDPAKNANDCIGWTDNSAAAFGRVWVFNNTTGGNGTLTSCNVSGGLKFACCK